MDRRPAVGAGDPVQDLARLLDPAAAQQVVRRFRQPEAEPEADQGRQRGQREQPAPGLVGRPQAGRPGGERHRDGADGPEALQGHQPAAAALGRQELGHHGVVDRQRAADADPGQQPQARSSAKLGEDRGQPEGGVDQHGDDQHPAAADPVGEPAEAPGAQQHAEEEGGAGLDRLRDRQAEARGERGCGEADRQHLHRVRRPDQAEDRQQAMLERADADPELDQLVRGAVDVAVDARPR